MTDYFALLGQPRQPWLDPDELKQAFHAHSLQTHPDTQPTAGDGEFTQLNEAYQTLLDPKRRLHHLLTLAGAAPQPAGAAVPPEIAELFPVIATLSREVERLLEKNAAATSALSRSLLRAELVQVQQRMTEALATLGRLQEESTARLQQMSVSWQASDAAAVAELHQLYLRFSYLTRWTTDLREKQLQL
jgi:curved DNA-binding protein CbpA